MPKVTSLSSEYNKNTIRHTSFAFFFIFDILFKCIIRLKYTQVTILKVLERSIFMKRIISIFLSLLMIFSVVSLGTIASSARDIEICTNWVTTPEYESPTIKVVRLTENGEFYISWNPIEKAASYTIYSLSDQNKYTVIGKNINKTYFKYKPSTIQQGKTYRFSVATFDSRGYKKSDYGLIKELTVMNSAKITSITRTTGTKATIKWNRVFGVEKYAVYSRISKTAKWSLICRTKETELTLPQTSVGTDFCVGVCTSDNKLCSILDEKIMTLNYENKAPKLLSISKANGLEFTTYDENTSYRIYKKEDGKWKNESTMFCKNAGKHSYKPNNLTKGDTYTVCAVKYTDESEFGFISSLFNTQGIVYNGTDEEILNTSENKWIYNDCNAFADNFYRIYIKDPLNNNCVTLPISKMDTSKKEIKVECQYKGFWISFTTHYTKTTNDNRHIITEDLSPYIMLLEL